MQIAMLFLMGVSGHFCTQTGLNASPQMNLANPISVVVELKDELKQEIQKQLTFKQLHVVHLLLQNLEITGDSKQLKGFDLFFNFPGAALDDAVESPNYVTSFALGLEKTETMIFNVAPALTKLWELDADLLEKPLLVTLVPNFWDEPIKGGEKIFMVIENVRLQLPDTL